MPRKRVLYFTCVPIMDEANGGNLSCRNHIRRLVQDPNIELFVAVVGHPQWEAGTRAFAAEMGVWIQFDYFVGGTLTPKGSDLRGLAGFAATMLLQTPWDLQAWNQAQVDRGLTHVIAALSIDVLVIDYTVSALYVRLPRDDVKTAVIKLGREEEFYRDMLATAPTHHGRWTRAASVWRWGRIERRIDRDVDQVITIGAPDLPRHPTRRPPVCITPTLDFKADAWLYSGSRSAFFVGSMGHYPNRLAIEWIATRLSPAVAALGADIRFTVIGAAEAEVPETWRHPAVDYLGASDRAEVERQFRSADLFLCPVSNTFGMKFKMAEALAFGIPMLAAPESMLCVPYLPASPNLPLDDPASAAKAVCALVGNAEALQARSSLQRALQEQFVDTQQGIWSRTLPFH